MSPYDGLVVVVTAIIFAIFLAYGVALLRTGLRRWIGILAIAFVSAIFIAAGFGLHYANQVAEAYVQARTASKSLPPLPADWGKGFPVEERTRYSFSMARTEYIERGRIREYFDLDGTRRSFMPDEKEQRARQMYLEDVEMTRRISNWAEISIYGLALLYVIAIALGHLQWWQQIIVPKHHRPK